MRHVLTIYRELIRDCGQLWIVAPGNEYAITSDGQDHAGGGRNAAESRDCSIPCALGYDLGARASCPHLPPLASRPHLSSCSGPAMWASHPQAGKMPALPGLSSLSLRARCPRSQVLYDYFLPQVIRCPVSSQEFMQSIINSRSVLRGMAKEDPSDAPEELSLHLSYDIRKYIQNWMVYELK
jgi:hypothetical protein